MSRNQFYRVRALTNGLCKENADVLVNSLWASYHLFRDMYEETSEGDCVLIYNPMGEIIEYRINDGNNLENNKNYRKICKVVR